MPKTKLSKEKDMLNDLNQIIDYKKIDLDLNDADIADVLMCCPRTFAYKKKKGSWSREDLINLFRVLRFTPDEIVKVMHA